jgi:hypothetical protein
MRHQERRGSASASTCPWMGPCLRICRAVLCKAAILPRPLPSRRCEASPIVTIQSLVSNKRSSSGITVFSLVLSSTCCYTIRAGRSVDQMNGFLAIGFDIATPHRFPIQGDHLSITDTEYTAFSITSHAISSAS